MRKLFCIVAALAIAVLCSASAQTETTGTTLVIHARWDTGTNVQGVVTLDQVNPTGPESVLVTKNLSSGGASFQTVLVANSVYNVNLTASDGTLLAKFPVATVLINPANLSRAGITLVFNSTDKSLKSASVDVQLNF
jgi:hypothetical protein